MAKRQPIVQRRKAVALGKSEQELSVLVRQKLGIDIDPAKLRKFVCDKFVILSILCHEIHEAEERSNVPS